MNKVLEYMNLSLREMKALEEFKTGVREKNRFFENALLDQAFEINLRYDLYISPRIIAVSSFEDPLLNITPFFKNLEREAVGHDEEGPGVNHITASEDLKGPVKDRKLSATMEEVILTEL
jgi:hypothetical protein